MSEAGLESAFSACRRSEVLDPWSRLRWMERLTVAKEDKRTTLALLLPVIFPPEACGLRDDNSLQPGLVAIHEGRYGEAERYFKGLLAKDPKNPYGLLNLGMALARLGKIEGAA